MKSYKYLIGILAASAAFAALAEEETPERDVFRKWRISVGGALNGAARASTHARNVPQPTGSSYVLPAGMSRDEAKARAERREFDGNGYIKNDDQTGMDWPMTENWSLPVGSYNETAGRFELLNKYEGFEQTDIQSAGRDSSSDEYQFGISAEISREIWIHDEEEEHRWGVDFAAAFSYFFRNDFYKARGAVSRVDTIREGAWQTNVEARDAMYEYIEETDPAYKDYPVNGMYGHGNAFATGFAPALNVNGIGAPFDVPGDTRTVTSSSSYYADGDYQELEMLFMFRPWYELTDWWRVFAQVGVGVSWGRFTTDFNATGISASEDFDQWDVYGVAGLGTMFRYGAFDISVDAFGRFLRDDFDVSGRYVSGKIERANWCLRVMLGYEF